MKAKVNVFVGSYWVSIRYSYSKLTVVPCYTEPLKQLKAVSWNKLQLVCQQ